MKGKTRRSVVVLAVVAMIAALLAIPVAPAGAASAACDNAPSKGFTDLTGFAAETVNAVDCIAFYGITQGTSATTYGPDGNVTRWQMALFLTRKLAAASVALPSGAPQGFTDIAGFDAATQTAINQLAQLNVTKGTSATTFDPNGIVTRWQMALFITRQLTAGGVTLPSGAAQGFTDIGTLDAATQTAINQLAQLGISKGTSATTYDPMGNVNRWQMALFLARDLDAMGVTAPGTLQVSVAPSAKASLGQGSARAYTATFKNSDGTLYTGFVGVELVDASASDAPVYNTAATGVVLETVDGVANGTTQFNGYAGTDGMVTFVVRQTSATATDVVPVAWIDLDGDSTYETTGNVAPTEPYGLGGEIDFSGTGATEAATGGPWVDLVISAASSGVFEAADAATDCGNGVGVACSFYYDSNDVYIIEGAPTDMASFAAAASIGDYVTVSYNNAVAGVSSFDITYDQTASSNLKVTDPSAAKSIDSNTYLIKGTGEVGASIRVYSDAANNGYDATDTVLGTDTVAADGTWSVLVPLVQNTANNFTAYQKIGTASPTYADVPTITEGAPAAAKLLSSTGANVAPSAAGTLGPNDTITIVFNEAITGVGAGDTVTIIDQDGSTAVLTNGDNASFAYATTTITNDTLVITVDTFVFATGGTVTGIQPAAQVQAVSGFNGLDGLDINVAGSGSGRVFDSF
jgi:hypothetical protein